MCVLVELIQKTGFKSQIVTIKCVCDLRIFFIIVYEWKWYVLVKQFEKKYLLNLTNFICSLVQVLNLIA